MFNIWERFHTVCSLDETSTTDPSATPSVVADATMSPLSPLGTLLDFLSISSSHPVPHLPGPVAEQSIPSPPQYLPEEDDPATDSDALERERDTAYGKVSFAANSGNLRLRLIPNGTHIPPLQEEEEDEEELEEQLQPSPSCEAVAQLEREIQEREIARDKAVIQYEERERQRQQRKLVPTHLMMNSSSEDPEDLSSSVRRNGRKEHRANPYPRPRGSKPKKHARFHLSSSDCQGLQDYDEFDLYPRRHTTELPIVRDAYSQSRPPTPYQSATAIPEYDLDEQEWVHTRPNTPLPTESPGLRLFGVRNVVRQPTVEKIDLDEDDDNDDSDDDDDCANVVAQTDAQNVAPVVDHAVTPELLAEAHALLTDTFAELQSASASGSPSPVRVYTTYLTPARSTPGLYADSAREISPVESPAPKTPHSPPGGFDSQVEVRSPEPPGYEEVFGTSDDEDIDDVSPNPGNKSEETATAENAETAPLQRSPSPAPALAERVLAPDIPSQHPLPPSSTMHAVDLQREMSWTALPISSLPATATTQPSQVQPPPTFTQSSLAWGQPVQRHAPTASSWSQCAFTVSVPPSAAPSTLSQPIAFPQLHPFVPNDAAPPQAQAEADMTMDVDPYVAPQRPRRNRPPRHRVRVDRDRGYRRAAHDPRRAARQLLRVAAVEPAVDLRTRAARRLFGHLFAIRERPAAPAAGNPYPLQGDLDRAVRKSVVAQRHDRDALRRARRSARPALRRLGRAASSSPSRAAPAPEPLRRRTLSVEMAMAIEEPVPVVVGLFDRDVDMDGSGDLPAMPASGTTVTAERMSSGNACRPSAPLIPIPTQPTIPVSITIPIIIVTPDTPLPQPRRQSREKPAAVAESAPPPAPSVVQERPVTASSGAAQSAAGRPRREEGSWAEFEVPLVEAAAPAPAPAPAPTTAAVPEATAATDRTPAAIPDAAAGDDAGEASDDETEWESVPIPAVSGSAPAAPAATVGDVPVDESASPAESVSAPAELGSAAEVRGPTRKEHDVAAPSVAEPGPVPVIVFCSNTQGGDDEDEDDDDDAISLGYSEDEAERRAIYGEDAEGYADEDEEDEDYEDDGEDGEDDEEDETEEETETEEEGDEEENNEYDESAPINGPGVKRTPASAPAPAPARPVSLPMLTPDKSSASPTDPVPTGLSGGPYIGSVAERYDESAAHANGMQLLTSTANVSSRNRPSGAAAQEARAQARLRNHANQVRQRNAAQDLIRSIAIAGRSSPPEVEGAPSPMPTPDPAPFEAAVTTPTRRFSGRIPSAADNIKDRVMTERAPDDVVMPADHEDTEITIALPRLDKGKGKAADRLASVVARAPDVDPSMTGVIDGLGLSPAEVRLNLNAFPRDASESSNKPAFSYECGCGRLSDGPSSGHTVACQTARGIPPVAPNLKPPSDSGFGSSIGAFMASALSPSGAHRGSRSWPFEVSPQTEQSSSMLETEASTILVDQGDRKSTCLPTSRPVADEQSTPVTVTKFIKEDTDQQLTGVAKAWDNMFVAPLQTSVVPESLSKTQELWSSAPDSTGHPLHASTLSAATLDRSAMDVSAEVHKMFDALARGTFIPHDDVAMNQEVIFSPAETALFAGLDFSALASGLSADPALDQQLLDLLCSIPDPANFIPIDGPVVDDSAPQDVASAPLVSASEVGCMPTILSQVQEVGNLVSEEENPERREVDAEIISSPLAPSLNDQRPDQSSQVSVLGFAFSEEQPHLESGIPVFAEGPSQVDTRTESGIPETAVRQPQSPPEQSLPANWIPPSSIEQTAPLPPARASVPSSSPIPQDEIAHPIAEEDTEGLDRVEDPRTPSEPEVEGRSPQPDVPAPPPTPLVRRRSGGLHDRIACSYEKRTYYGPRPSSAHWQAFIAAPPLRAHCLPSGGATNKFRSSASSLHACFPARPSGPSRLSTTSASPDASTIAEPAQPRVPSRGRPRRRAAALEAVDVPKSKKDVATQTTQTDASSFAAEKRKSSGRGKRVKETGASPSLSRNIAPPHPPHRPPLDSRFAPEPHRLPSWLKPYASCCPDFSRTGQAPCIHVLRATGQLAGTRWESESSDSDLDEEKNVSWPQGWSAGYLAKLSLAAGACYFLENVVF